jgi:Domain of unknown function (DUF4328)/Protein of unknown function (DUF2510)
MVSNPRSRGHTPPVTTTPAGWYPDGQDPSLLRWWDGSQWSTHTVQSRREPGPYFTGDQRPALGRGWFTLSLVVENALRFSVMISLAYVAVDFWGHRMFGSWRLGPEEIDQSEAEFYDTVGRWLSVADIVLFFLTGVLFIIWLFRAHRSDRMYPAQLRHASGWAIGGWFVPILNLWRPPQMVLDVRRGASGTGWPSTALVLWWWWILMVSNVVQSVANSLAPSADAAFGTYVEDVRRSLVVDASASILAAIAAVLAILVVRSTVRLVRDSPHAVAASTPGLPDPTVTGS